jgi:tRNA (Thr-GGU) A37 N-methylase
VARYFGSRCVFGSSWIDSQNCDNKRDNYSSHSGFRPNRVIITFLRCKKVKNRKISKNELEIES